MATNNVGAVPGGIAQAISSYFNRGLEALRAEALEEARSGRIGVVRTRFKEGFTTEEQFKDELKLLGVPEEELDLELAAAKLDYSTDYLRELITAYREAFRKGHLSMEEYREKLVTLGLVPERIESYVMIERARLKPEEALTAAPVPKPYYETDAGKVIVDTIRRGRRKLFISKDQEIASLLELGMPIALATATADNDDVRLAEKVGEE